MLHFKMMKLWLRVILTLFWDVSLIFARKFSSSWQKKGKPAWEFSSSNWMQDLVIVADVTEQLNNLNKMLEESNSYDAVLWQFIVGDATRSWWRRPLSLSEGCVLSPTCHTHKVVEKQKNSTIAGIEATFSGFWWARERLQCFLFASDPSASSLKS